MPCIYEETPEEKRKAREAANAKVYLQGWNACEKQMQDFLCSACTALERLGYNFAENPQLDRWWDKHKKEDAERQASELAKKELAAKKKLEREKAVHIAETKSVTALSKDEKALLKKHGLL